MRAWEISRRSYRVLREGLSISVRFGCGLSFPFKAKAKVSRFSSNLPCWREPHWGLEQGYLTLPLKQKRRHQDFRQTYRAGGNAFGPRTTLSSLPVKAKVKASRFFWSRLPYSRKAMSISISVRNFGQGYPSRRSRVRGIGIIIKPTLCIRECCRSRTGLSFPFTQRATQRLVEKHLSG